MKLYNHSFANYQNLCSKWVPHSKTQWLRCKATGR